MIEVSLEAIMAFAVGLAGFVFTLWRWDSSRLEKKLVAKENSEKLSAAGEEQLHRLTVDELQARIDRQEKVLVRLQYDIMKRLIDLVESDNEGKREMASSLGQLSQGVEGFQVSVFTQYQNLSSQIDDLLDRCSATTANVAKLVEEFSLHHSEMIQALKPKTGGSSGD